MKEYSSNCIYLLRYLSHEYLFFNFFRAKNQVMNEIICS